MFSLLNKEVKNIIVFDLEWNQSSFHTNHRIPHEIIEIGACRVSREGNVLDRFSRLIRPRVYQKLDKHIKQVTGITEDELANGKPFSDVFGDFIAWCGEDVQLVTWGRDDYPVLKRNAAFFMTPMPFEPPMDAQLIFGFCCLGGAHQQMNLHAAMEKMEIELDAPAHRAVYDAECTAALLGKIDEALCVLPPERRMQLEATLEKEKRIAASALRSLPTPYMYQTDALADQKFMSLPCPAWRQAGRRLIRRGLTADGKSIWRFPSALSTGLCSGRCTLSARRPIRSSCTSVPIPPAWRMSRMFANAIGSISLFRRKSVITV